MSAVVIVGAQWGDEGKGKIVDIYMESAEVVVRYAGGPNAGHTLVVGDEKLIVRLLPSGILRPNTRCIMGQGMVVDPAVLIGEIDELKRRGHEEVEKRLPGFPIVLHGASSVVPEYVDTINKYGGDLENAVGVPEDQLRKASESAVCKINIDSDGRLAMTATIREVLATKPKEFDPRKYLGPAREELVKMYKHKNENVLGSAGKA